MSIVTSNVIFYFLRILKSVGWQFLEPEETGTFPVKKRIKKEAAASAGICKNNRLRLIFRFHVVTPSISYVMLIVFASHTLMGWRYQTRYRIRYTDVTGKNILLWCYSPVTGPLPSRYQDHMLHCLPFLLPELSQHGGFLISRFSLRSFVPFPGPASWLLSYRQARKLCPSDRNDRHDQKVGLPARPVFR